MSVVVKGGQGLRVHHSPEIMTKVFWISPLWRDDTDKNFGPDLSVDKSCTFHW